MKILIPIDGSDCSKAAVKSVAKRAWEDGTEVRVYSVLEPLESLVDPGLVLCESKIVDELKEIQLDCTREARVLLEGNLPNCQVTVFFGTGNVKQQVLGMVEKWRPDLIVMGSHGRRGFERFLVGSVCEAVAEHCSCPIEIVKLLPKPAEGGEGGETKNTVSHKAQILMK